MAAPKMLFYDCNGIPYRMDCKAVEIYRWDGTRVSSWREMAMITSQHTLISEEEFNILVAIQGESAEDLGGQRWV
jgi:hypothetical protein